MRQAHFFRATFEDGAAVEYYQPIELRYRRDPHGARDPQTQAAIMSYRLPTPTESLATVAESFTSVTTWQADDYKAHGEVTGIVFVGLRDMPDDEPDDDEPEEDNAEFDEITGVCLTCGGYHLPGECPLDDDVLEREARERGDPPSYT